MRSSYFDFIKGLAIIGVIAIHTVLLNYNAYSLSGMWVIFLRNTIGCCVPIFVAASGYFLINKCPSTFEDYKRFIKKRFSTIYLPMLVWAIPWVLLSIVRNHSICGISYAFVMYFVGGLSIFYFITLMCQLYLLLPVIKNIKWGGVIALISLSVGMSFFWKIGQWDVPMVVYCSFPTYIGYFALGACMRMTNTRIHIKLMIIITVITAILSVLETYYWVNINFSNSGTLGHKPSVALYSVCIILLLFSSNVKEAYKGSIYTKYIEKCGINSFSMYLTHCLFIPLLGAVCQIPSWLFRWFIVLLLDVLFVHCIKYVIPIRWHKYLGIR